MSRAYRETLWVWAIIEVRDRQKFESTAAQLDMMHTKPIGLFDRTPPCRGGIESFSRQKLNWPGLSVTVNIKTSYPGTDCRDA
ncbi:MAG: hypothetical protein WBQ21_15010 [Solirubrobacteraceae bacterium]